MPGYPIAETVTAEELIEEMVGNGVEKIINLVHPATPEETISLNLFNAELAKKYDCIYAFTSIVPADRNKEDVLRHAFFDLGLIGLKIHPFAQRMSLTDPAMEEVWSCCEKWGRPVYIHTGYESSYNHCTDEMSLEAGVRSILERHPQLPVVICHCFFPYLERGFRLAGEFSSVYLDLTGIPISIRRVHPYTVHAAETEKILRAKLPDYSGRVIFGSDHPVGGGSVAQIYEDFFSLDLDETLITQIVYDTPKKFIEQFRI